MVRNVPTRYETPPTVKLLERDNGTILLHIEGECIFYDMTYAVYDGKAGVFRSHILQDMIDFATNPIEWHSCEHRMRVSLVDIETTRLVAKLEIAPSGTLELEMNVPAMGTAARDGSVRFCGVILATRRKDNCSPSARQIRTYSRRAAYCRSFSFPLLIFRDLAPCRIFHGRACRFRWSLAVNPLMRSEIVVVEDKAINVPLAALSRLHAA